MGRASELRFWAPASALNLKIKARAKTEHVGAEIAPSAVYLLGRRIVKMIHYLRATLSQARNIWRTDNFLKSKVKNFSGNYLALISLALP